MDEAKPPRSESLRLDHDLVAACLKLHPRAPGARQAVERVLSAALVPQDARNRHGADYLIDALEQEPAASWIVVREHPGTCLCGECPALGVLTGRELAALLRAGKPAAQVYAHVAIHHALVRMAVDAKRHEDAPVETR